MAVTAALLVLMALWFPFSARADPTVSIAGTLESDTAWRIRSPRRIQKSQNQLELEVELGFSDAWELRAVGRLRADPVGRLVGSSPDFGQRPIDRWQVGGSRHLEAELREIHLDWHGRLGAAYVDLRIGKQQVVWGQSFGLRVLDSVNAQDFQEFILDDFVDSRTPVFGVRADVAWGGLSLQMLLVPDFEADALPDFESEYALDLELPGLIPDLVPVPTRFSPGAPSFLVRLEDERQPGDWRGSTLAWGLRLAGFHRGVDWLLHYWDRFDPTQAIARRVEHTLVAALGDIRVPLNVIVPGHVRVRTLGFSFSTSRGSYTLWGEGGVSTGRAYAVNDPSDRDGLVRRRDLQVALGLDWTGIDGLFANLQWIQRLVFDPPSSLEVDRARSFVSLLLRLNLRHDTVFPQLFVLVGTNAQDTMIRPSLEWRPTDQWSITFGLDLFTGPRDGLLGQYARARNCTRVPTALVSAGARACLFDDPPGRASRVFLRFRYSFSRRW